MDLTTARAHVHAMLTDPDGHATAELDRRLDALISAAVRQTSETNKPSFWRDAEDTNFFETRRIYAARAGWPGGRERFRFYCTEVTTDPETGKPRAYGWHGRLRTADGAWSWIPNARTYDDWNLGTTWTDITDEPNCDEGVYLNAKGHILDDDQELVDGGEYLDRHGDTWRFLGGIKEFMHVKRADEETPAAGPNVVRHCECAALIARDFGPMTKTVA